MYNPVLNSTIVQYIRQKQIIRATAVQIKCHVFCFYVNIVIM